MSAGDKKQPRGDSLLELRERLAAETGDSLKLIANPQDNPICSISLDESIPAVVVVWKGYATSNQFRFIHEYILSLLEKYGVSKILADDTELPMIHEEDQSWVTTNWMPRAVAAGLRTGASKSSASYFGQAAISSVLASAHRELDIRIFGNLDQAKRWLQETKA